MKATAFPWIGVAVALVIVLARPTPVSGVGVAYERDILTFNFTAEQISPAPQVIIADPPPMVITDMVLGAIDGGGSLELRQGNTVLGWFFIDSAGVISFSSGIKIEEGIPVELVPLIRPGSSNPVARLFSLTLSGYKCCP